MIPVHSIDIDTDLALRRIMPMDAEDVFNMIDSEREYLGQWLPFVKATTDLDYTVSFMNAILNTNTEDKADVYTIRYQDRFIGIVGFKFFDLSNKKTELGYWLSQHFQHKGIMTRCVKYLCEEAFRKKDINRIQIKCAVGNHNSSAIPLRLGFTLEGLERDGELHSNGQFLDLEVYSKLRSESF